MAKSNILTKFILLLSLVAIIKSDDDYDVYNYEKIRTSCNKTLCEDVETFPYNDVVYGLRKIFSDGMSILSYSLGLWTKAISPEVYRKAMLLPSTAERSVVQEKDCKTYTNFYPQEGQSVDGNVYHIVNVIKKQQPVSKIECREFCYIPKTNYLKRCFQYYEEQELLVLPLDWNKDIANLQLKKFKVPNNCACVGIGRKDISSAHLFTTP